MSSTNNCESSSFGEIFPDINDVVWVNKRYIPIDLRSTAPVAQFKFINPSKFPPVPDAWKQPINPPIQYYSRHREEKQFYPSSPSTRCEEWSTLRQMLPSKGRPLKQSPPRWGTNHNEPLQFVGTKSTRYPKINSPMTNDKMADDYRLNMILPNPYYPLSEDRREKRPDYHLLVFPNL